MNNQRALRIFGHQAVPNAATLNGLIYLTSIEIATDIQLWRGTWTDCLEVDSSEIE